MTPESVFYPVTPERHGEHYWQRYNNYSFAASHCVLPLLGAELAKAAQAFVIAFIARGSSFEPAAVVGLQPGSNLFVANDGSWLGAYIPSVLRSYPFMLLPAENNQLVLCVDETSGLISQAPGGERFFTPAGELSAQVRSVFDFLVEIRRYMPVTEAACKLLQEAGLIEPWPASVTLDGTSMPVEGLHRINERAMDSLPDEAFLKLRKSGALMVAYTQLLSMQHMEPLKHLTESRAAAAAASAATQSGKELDLSFMQGDTLRF